MQLTTLISLVMLTSLAATPAYAKNDNHNGNLPPGLQKKAAKGQALPPGWQKKLQKGSVIDRDIYQQSSVVVPVDKHGLLTIRVEGKLIKLYEATREIVEIIEKR